MRLKELSFATEPQTLWIEPEGQFSAMSGVSVHRLPPLGVISRLSAQDSVEQDDTTRLPSFQFIGTLGFLLFRWKGFHSECSLGIALAVLVSADSGAPASA
jgi:hypothetical protein